MREYFEDKAKERKFRDILQCWIGTPYMHMGTKCGRGADCSKFIGLCLVEAGILRRIEPREHYSKDWHIHGKREVVLDSFRRHVEKYLLDGLKIEKVVDSPKFGDVLTFSTSKSGLSNHTAIAINEKEMVHAINKIGVTVAQINYHWKTRLTNIFRAYEV